MHIRISAGPLAVLAVIVASLVLSASASAGVKPYSLVVCATGQDCAASGSVVIAPGSAFGTTPTPASVTVTLTNETKPGAGIKLGSANMTAPAGFSVTGLTPLPACATPLPQNGPPCVYLVNGGNVVQFRNMGLGAPGAVTVTMSVLTPQPSTTTCTTTAPCFWSIAAKQSNDFSGTGNDLNLDSANSSSGTVTSSVVSCTAGKSCSTRLADGGTKDNAPGSISSTISAGSGQTTAVVTQSLNYGQPYACDGFPEPGHESGFWNVTGGTDRAKTISETTTVFSGYQQEVCLDAPWQFTQKVTSSTSISLVPASPTTAPDGSGATWFIGLLPDCGNLRTQVKPSKDPCIVRSQTTNDGLTATTVFSVPAGRPGDPTRYN